jgi:hypothetical protein
VALKLSPLTNYELDFIRWQIWEPLRRNPRYKSEFAKLKQDPLDRELEDKFCQKWNLPYSVNPDWDFEKLLESPERIKQLFWFGYGKEEGGLYTPIFDHAAFVDAWDWIVNGKYLKVWIDLESSKNRIEQALKKILDEWWSDKWPNFYGGKRNLKLKSKSVHVKSLVGKYLELHINLEAPRTTKIKPEIKEILTEWLSKGEGEKERISKLHAEKWDLCFRVYDLAQSKKPLPAIALELNIKSANTAYKQFRRAWDIIHPGETYPARKKKTYMDRGLMLIELCRACPKNNSCPGAVDAEGNVLCRAYYEISRQEDDIAIGLNWDSLEYDKDKIDHFLAQQAETSGDGSKKPY